MRQSASPLCATSTQASYPHSLVSTPAQIAKVVYEAATDGTDTLRYVCGKDAKGLYTQRLSVGDEAFRKGVQQLIAGTQALVKRLASTYIKSPLPVLARGS